MSVSRRDSRAKAQRVSEESEGRASDSDVTTPGRSRNAVKERLHED
jgi:hypothetical protein